MISNANWSNSGYPGTDDEAWMDTFTDSSGITYAVWGDAFTEDSTDITAIMGANTEITMTLEIDNLDMVTAKWDFYTGGVWSSNLIVDDFKELAFYGDEFYVGGFYAAEELPIPEPTTIALLGIGLAGLAGTAVRQRFRNKKDRY